MFKRLTEFINQTKSISVNSTIYFDKGFSYTYHPDQLVQAICDFRKDKKAKEFFNNATFKLIIQPFFEFTKTWKNDISRIDLDSKNKRIKIITNISDVSLQTEWYSTDDQELKKIKLFFKRLDNSLNESKWTFSYDFSLEQIKYYVSEKPKRFFAELNGEVISFNKEDFKDSDENDILTISILPKYLGKIAASTKSLNVKIWPTESSNKDSLENYYIKFTVQNSELVTSYYGICTNDHVV